MVSEEEMKSCIQEWIAQALCIEDLAKIYATIISEADKQLAYMSEQIKDEIVRNNKQIICQQKAKSISKLGFSGGSYYDKRRERRIAQSNE